MVAADLQERTRFKQVFNRLAVATRLSADQADAAAQRIYFEGLLAIPIDAVEAAADSLAKTATWFPKLAEWRDRAEQAQHTQALSRALPSGTREWHSECGTCDDTGWEPLTCDGAHEMCGRGKVHAAHDYTVPCACRPTNHTYQRRLAEQRQRARGRKGDDA